MYPPRIAIFYLLACYVLPTKRMYGFTSQHVYLAFRLASSRLLMQTDAFWRLFLSVFFSKLCNQVPSLEHLKFFGFSLLKIRVSWVLWCIKVLIFKQSYCELMQSCQLFTNLNFDTSLHPTYLNFLWVRVFHLEELKEGTWLHSFGFFNTKALSLVMVNWA